MPIDQIISHIASTNLEKQQVVQTCDNQAGAENTSAEASRRSSTSTQNTDTLTPTNIPSDLTDNGQETIISAIPADTVVETHHNIQDDANNSVLKSHQSSTTSAQSQIQDTTVNANAVNEVSKESQELQDVVEMKEREMVKEMSASDVAAELSTLPVPAPTRKVSRFLVSPVVEQKNIAPEEESSTTSESTDRANVTTSQSPPVASIVNVEAIPKNEDHVEANILEAQTAAVHEQIGNIETAGAVQYPVEQVDNTQQVLQQGQQSIGAQNIVQMQTLQQQVTGHVQQTIGQPKQQTIIVQGTTVTSQQTSQQQMPQTGVQNFIAVNSQKELQSQPLHTMTNGIVQQTQYQSHAVIQPGVVMQQQIPMQQQSLMQPLVQTEHQLQGQMQATQRSSVQQFIPQHVHPPTQQYVMLSGQPMQPIQPTNMDERIRRIPNASANVSVDPQILESSGIVEEKRQAMAVNASMTHIQHVQVPQDMSSGGMLPQGVVETAQHLQTTYQNVQHAPGAMPPSMPQVPLPVHPIAATDVSTPKVVIKTKEGSSTFPDLAQNLANILSNPKSKSTTPHPLTNHEPAVASNVVAPTLIEHKPVPVQSEQYFQPIQPEVSQLQIQPPVLHNYQGQIIYQGYQGQPNNFQQAFQSQQLLHQGQVQPIPQSIPLMIPQQVDAHTQMVHSTFQNLSAQLSAQGKWVVSTSQAQQPIRHIQPSQPQPLQHQSQLQQIPVQSQIQQQIMQDQQYNESTIISDQSQLQLKLTEQHSTKYIEAETLESSNLDWYVNLLHKSICFIFYFILKNNLCIVQKYEEIVYVWRRGAHSSHPSDENMFCTISVYVVLVLIASYSCLRMRILVTM